MLSFQTTTSQISNFSRTLLKDKYAVFSPSKHQFYIRKRAVLCTFSKAGSLTLEAAVVIPLFLLAMMSVLSFVQVLLIQMRILIPMENVAREMAQYVYLQEKSIGEEVIDSLPGHFVSGGISIAAARKRIVDAVGEQWLEDCGIVDGKAGLSFLFSRIPDEENMVDVVVHYRVQLKVCFVDIPSIPITQRCCVRGWVGKVPEKEDASTQMVYITDSGTVYHKSLGCRHLQLSIQQVYLEDVASLRNQSGGKYYPCESCKKSEGLVVYITDTGNRYHSTLSCKGIKRGIQKVTIKEAGTRTACKRCGG